MQNILDVACIKCRPCEWLHLSSKGGGWTPALQLSCSGNGHTNNSRNLPAPVQTDVGKQKTSYDLPWREEDLLQVLFWVILMVADRLRLNRRKVGAQNYCNKCLSWKIIVKRNDTHYWICGFNSLAVDYLEIYKTAISNVPFQTRTETISPSPKDIYILTKYFI